MVEKLCFGLEEYMEDNKLDKLIQVCKRTIKKKKEGGCANVMESRNLFVALLSYLLKRIWRMCCIFSFS